MYTKVQKRPVATALGAVVAVVAALFLGTGTAHANPAENNELLVRWDVIPEGLRAYVQNKTGQGSHCFYRSYNENLPSGLPTIPLPVPLYGHNFYLPPGGTADWVISGIPMGQYWRTTVDCPGVGNLVYRGRY